MPNPRVLIIDDTALSRIVIAHMVSRLGFDCVEVASGEEALIALRRECFDLVLLDIMLPGMDGFQVLGRIREAGVAIPVLAVTGKVGAREECLAAGFAGCLAKPFNVADLAEAIGGLLTARAF
jgi:CheY-like chemotaxis protein